jgi:hypothetical protein
MAMGMVFPDKNQLTNLKEVRTAYQIDGTYPIAQHRATYTIRNPNQNKTPYEKTN